MGIRTAHVHEARVFYQEWRRRVRSVRGLLNEVLGLSREGMDDFTGIAVKCAKEPIV